MSLEVVNTKTLWTASAYDIGAVANYGSNRIFYWKTDNTLEVDADNIPADTWHKIDVYDADKLMIAYSGIVNTTTGAGNLTESELRIHALGIPKGLSFSNVNVAPPIGADIDDEHGSLKGMQLRVGLCSYRDGTLVVSESPGAHGMSSVGALYQHGLVLADGTPAAANDETHWLAEIGWTVPTSTQSNTGVNGVTEQLSVSMFSTVYVSLCSVARASADNNDITDYDGEMKFITYRDVQKVDKIDRRNQQRNDLPATTPGAGE